MGAPRGAGEIPLLSLFFHLLDGAEAGRVGPPSGAKVRPPGAPIRVEDSVRWGVWLGRHICQKITQVS